MEKEIKDAAILKAVVDARGITLLKEEVGTPLKKCVEARNAFAIRLDADRDIILGIKDAPDTQKGMIFRVDFDEGGSMYLTNKAADELAISYGFDNPYELEQLVGVKGVEEHCVLAIEDAEAALDLLIKQ